GSLDVGHPETYRLWPWCQLAIHQGQHSADHCLRPSSPVDGDHSSRAVEAENGFDVEHASQPGPASGYATRADQVVVGVYGEQETRLVPDALQLLCDRRRTPA